MTPTQREPRNYTPRHLAEKILQSKAVLEGERKQVTVLFADVKGSMDLAAQLDPEEWHQLLERFFEILNEGVHRFEGTVNQYTGDGIMALFGAPVAHEDHALRACHAVLHMQDRLRELELAIRREYGVDFATRMGLNSGEVIVGAIGDDLRMDYTAQGHTVGLAKRLESLAEADSCYVSENTAALVSGYFALEDLGDFRVKGMAEPLRVHRLEGVGAARSRFDRARDSGFAHFVGRSADLRALQDALTQTAAGNGQVIGVVAEAGTGKSRLCFEFLKLCRARGLRVFQASAVAHGKNIPLLPILELLRAYFGISAADDGRATRRKITAAMAQLGAGFAEVVPTMIEFLGVTEPHEPAPQLSAEERHRQLIGVMRELIQNVGHSDPMVTMIEDLHWLDEASAEFLAHLVDTPERKQSLLLLNFRPEYHADWMQKSYYRQIALAPLDRDAIQELLEDLLGSHASLTALSEPIHERTRGNPFFIEEIAQSLIESGHLEGGPGRYSLVTPIDRLEVPTTVKAVLAARIDRLAERDKRVLQTASVIGKDFEESLLREVGELPPDELKSSLGALCAAEFLQKQSIYPVAEYRFKHPLTQEVALESQLRGRRRQVHAAVAGAIEATSGNLDERAALLAHHWEEAGEALMAARWHRRAAEWAIRTDFAISARHCERVRALLTAHEDEREAAELVVDACLQLLSTGWRVGLEIATARSLLQQGQRLASGLGDRSSHAMLALAYSRVVCANGDLETYSSLAVENYRASLEIEDDTVRAIAAMWLTDSHGHCGRFEEAVRTADEGLARTPRHVPGAMQVLRVEPCQSLSFWRGLSLNWSGQLVEGQAELERCRRRAEEDGSHEFAGYALWFTTEGHYFAGDADRAQVSAGRLEEISSRIENDLLAGNSSLALGLAHMAAGRVDDAIESLRTSLSLLQGADQSVACQPAAYLPVALLMSGDLSAALAAAKAAIAKCVETGRLHNAAVAHGVVARALLLRDGATASRAVEEVLAEVATLIEQTGARILAPSLQEWRAELAGVLGDDETRARHLSEARVLFEEIGAPLQALRIEAMSRD